MYRDRALNDVDGIYKQLSVILKNEKKNHRAPIPLRAPAKRLTCSVQPSVKALNASAPAVTFSCVTRVIQRVRNFWSTEEVAPKAERGAAKKAKLV